MKNKFGLIMLLLTLLTLVYIQGGCITVTMPGSSQSTAVPSLPTSLLPTEIPTAPPTTPNLPSLPNVPNLPQLPTTPTLPPAPGAQFAVTGATIMVDNPAYTGPCPKTFNFAAVITANGPGQITYRWERNDAFSSVQTLTFLSAGSQTITDYWQLGGNYIGWERVHILTPNELISNQAGFTLLCSGAATGAVAYVDNPSGPCPRLYKFTGTISVNGPCTVTYRWERSDGTAGPPQQLIFPAAGSAMVASTGWELGGNYSGWQRIHILSPNDIVSNTANFVNSCATGVVTGITVSGFSPVTPCPRTFNFTGSITANGPCTVTYQWERSDGASVTPQTITFASAGTQAVSYSWTLNTTTSGWVRLRIISPNALVSNNAVFSLTCP